MMSKQYDEIDERLLLFIRGFSHKTGHPPTYAEMAEGCALGSTGQVQYRLSCLEKIGMITRVQGQARSVRVKLGRKKGIYYSLLCVVSNILRKIFTNFLTNKSASTP
jgi:SOS-response transcriptional repressor LexA